MTGIFKILTRFGYFVLFYISRNRIKIIIIAVSLDHHYRCVMQSQIFSYIWILWFLYQTPSITPMDLTTILRRNTYYNKDVIPTYDKSTPTIVTIQMYIEGMSSFRAQSMVIN